MSRARWIGLMIAFTVGVASPLAMAGDNLEDSHSKHDHSKHDHAKAGTSHDGNPGPHHGGQFVVFDGHHGVEMVANDTSLVFHLSEDHKPMALEGGSFKAVIQSGAGLKIVALAPAGGTLTAVLEGALEKGAKVALTGKDSHGHTIQARFVKE